MEILAGLEQRGVFVFFVEYHQFFMIGKMIKRRGDNLKALRKRVERGRGVWKGRPLSYYN